MFRSMRRIKQQLAEDEALEVLKSAKRGVLSVIGDDGWPYGIHLNPYWEDGRLYFHGAKAGHKIDALRRDARASFTVIDDGVKDDGGWAYTFRSVIVFGRVEFVDDQEKALEVCRRLTRRFTTDEKYIEGEIKNFGAYVQVFALAHGAGKSLFYYGDWIKNPGVAIVSCNDGLRPVIMKLEATDEKSKIGYQPIENRVLA